MSEIDIIGILVFVAGMGTGWMCNDILGGNSWYRKHIRGEK